VNSIDDDDDDSTAELAIQEMIEAAQRMIRVNNSEGEEEPEITINPAMKRHFLNYKYSHCRSMSWSVITPSVTTLSNRVIVPSHLTGTSCHFSSLGKSN